MATIIANGNASIMSRAMYDTEDGYFEHDYSEMQSTSGANRNSGKGYTSGPKVFGPQTVWRNGVPYPNAGWAAIEVQPFKDPYHKGRWIHPNRIGIVKAYNSKKVLDQQREPDISEGGMNDSGYIKNKQKADARRSAYQATSSATKSGLNKVTNAIGNELSNMNSAGAREAARYRAGSKEFDVKSNTYVNKGNKVGEAMAYARGAVGNSAAVNAARNEAGNIKGGWDSATAAYDAAHRGQRTYTRDKNGNMVYTGIKGTGNALGRTAAGVKGAIGASAVGRAGKAAFKAITDKFDDFSKFMKKYISGPSAKLNRSRVFEELQTKASGLMSAIGSALGSSYGRKKTMQNMGQALGSAVGTVSGGVRGIAKGIKDSDIGKAAISAGQKAYGAVKDGVDGALKAITSFFKKKPSPHAPGGRVLEGA